MIKIGSKVIVTNWGEEYTSFDQWIKKNAPKYYYEWLKKDETYGNEVVKKNAYKVVAIADHGYDDGILYLLKNGNDIFLLNVDGIKLCARANKKYKRKGGQISWK